jgi:L-asparaginase
VLTRRLVILLAALAIQTASPAFAQQTLPVVVLLATGGTIAMKVDPVKKAPVPALSGDDLVAIVPTLTTHARLEVRNVFNVPSGYMDPDRWRTLTAEATAALARPEVAGVVITHGTDTLEETAWWLDLTVASDKPIVLIGAQRNASESDFDGPRNLLNAVRIAVDPQSRGKGSVVALNGQINAAREVTKTHTASVESFRSGDFGVLGEVDADRVVYWRAPLRRRQVPLVAGPLPIVDIVAMYGGADGSLVSAAVDRGARGIVIQALGMGNVNPAMFAAIKAAIARGVAVVICTRVANGRVLAHYGYDGGGQTLASAGAVMGDDLSPQKARILLMLLLQSGASDRTQLQAAFDRP